jgi:hypothetical protein
MTLMTGPSWAVRQAWIDCFVPVVHCICTRRRLGIGLTGGLFLGMVLRPFAAFRVRGKDVDVVVERGDGQPSAVVVEGE